MSLAASSETSGVLDAYRTRVRDSFLEASHGADELVTPEGVRGENESLAGTIEAMGLAGLLAARAETRNFVQDEGITYGSAAPGRRARHWSIDPIPLLIGASEWSELQRGLAQRSRLLDLVLADIYGERTLLRRRIIPPEIVLSHPGFIRQTDRIAAPGKRHLVMAAADLGRDTTGAWRVISDRTQAPSGAGYSMATRRVVSRVMAGAPRHRSGPGCAGSSTS
ncbi:MAG: circularly permuted type 2 ATP-grasp protein [Micropruina sp.]|nr:circularly permuted type 2 ATP-grasp protein [Micropruina sp.]